MGDHILETITLPQQPCPIDERRDTGELYIKLLVVSVTTLFSYYRLLKTKKKTCFTWSPLYFWLAPLSYVISYVLGLVFIFSIYLFGLLSRRFSPILDRNRGDRNPEARLKANLRCLFGKVPPNRLTYQQSTTRENQLLVGDGTEQTWNPVPETWKETAEMVGRLITATFFLALCVRTIVLYQRRREMNAVSTVSQRIFELACAGLVAGIFTLCYILRVPIFDQPIPE